MRINKKFKRIIELLMLAMIILNATFVNFTHATDSATIEKISNPDSGEGEADGIVPGGDREASYAWAMTTRGNYVYVGTNKNIIGGVATTFVDSIVAAGATEDQAWAMIDLLTENEIPRPTTTVGGEIFKCDITTGEITKIFTADDGVAFRMAIEFDGNLYFGSYSGDPTATNYIYKIDENDEVTVSFTSEYGTSMRAACIYNDELYFGGVDSRYALDEGDEDCVQLAIMKKDASDDTKWDRVADYKDFKEYASDSAIKNNVTSPIWDICSYDGYIYATIPNSLGIVMYKGHPAEGDETANEYGWHWTEIIGKNSEVNNIGLADTAEGQIGDNAGLITMAATPFVFNDKLYLMNFDNTIQAEMMALTGLLAAISNQGTENEPDLTDYLKPMYTTLNNPQKLWFFDDATGKFNEVETFQEFMVDTCNEYLWRTEIYNDELYITTMDSAVLYNWAIQLTGEHFTRLTEEELDTAVTEIDELLAQIEGLAASNTEVAELVSILEQTKVMITEYKTVMDDSEAFNDFVVEYEELIGQIEVLSETIISSGESNTLVAGLVELASKVDWDALRMYAYIVRMVENDTWGFDLIKTSDGENFEIVTDSGFGDKYNYGGRSLITTDAGLYVGTANPFYGAQLWRVSEGTTDDPTTNNPTQNTGATKEELEAVKEQLNTVIQNQARFEEEIERLSEELSTLKNSINNNVNNNSTGGKVEPDDTTTSGGKLPNTGNARIIITLVVVLAIGTVVTAKYIKYRNIDRH